MEKKPDTQQSYPRGHSDTDYVIRAAERATSSMESTIHELKTERANRMPEIAARMRNRFAVALLLALLIFLTSPVSELTLGFSVRPPIRADLFHLSLAVIALVYSGRHFFVDAWRSMQEGYGDSSILTVPAITLALTFSVVTTLFGDGPSFYYATAVIVTFAVLTQWLKYAFWGRALGLAKGMLDVIPESARVIKDQETTVVPTHNVRVGDILLIERGETIPVDGVVAEGTTAVVRAPMFREREPEVKTGGDEVFAGGINEGGAITIQATRVTSNTLLARAARMVEAAQRSPDPRAQLVKSAANYVILVAVIAGLAAFLVWDVASPDGVSFAFTVLLAILVAASPEALSLSVPIGTALGIYNAAGRGIMFKDARTLARVTDATIIVFDELRFLTSGAQRVSDVFHVGKLTEPGFMRLAASLSKATMLPFSDAIIGAIEEKVGRSIPVPEDFALVPGRGAIGEVETREVIVGNRRLMADRGINIFPVQERADGLASEGKIVVFVAVDNRIEGIIAIANDIRPEAREAVRELRDAGLAVAVVTVENRKTAESVASELGIDIVQAEVLPHAKADAIRRLQAHEKPVIVVGEGTDDAPALRQADIGLAIGAGPHLLIDSASIILIGHDLRDLGATVSLARAVRRNIAVNRAWGFAYNGVVLALAAGILYPVFFMRPEMAAVLSSVAAAVVIANSMRLQENR